MGICTSCCGDGGGGADALGSPGRTTGRQQQQQVNVNQPDANTRRQLQAKAAERRLKETESRGLADPEKVKRQQKKQADLDRAAEQTYPSDREGGLRWTTG
ncbi:hypothetical protein BV898_03595 [Hypsibius exemplaris]|uniref:Small VCP/p97-interacting protein n=1 Tax=Hypsibius exemplaris TaxID=2072580 RepID=A0A1W0X4N5_HYPEX|nr:hypothetical protein BV898_03595 [Hypsibius exemplaris]